jgi:hypothetical protein
MKLRKTRHLLDKQGREKSVALLNDLLVPDPGIAGLKISA